jgi:hypothetical protein
MAIPLIPFVAGAVIGGLAAYLYRDDRLRRRMRHAAGDVTDKARDTAEIIGDTLSDAYDGLRDKVTKKGAAAEPAAVEEPVAETAAPKKAAKKTSARRKVSTKKSAAKPAAAEDAKTENAED